jgi:hypothetical protein
MWRRWLIAASAVLLAALTGCASATGQSGAARPTLIYGPSNYISISQTRPSASALPPRRTTQHSTPPPIHATGPYQWVGKDPSSPFVNGATFTLVKGLTPAEALRVLAPDAKTPLESPGSAADWALVDPMDRSAIEATSRDGWTMILEPNGFRAADLTTLGKLSARGSAVSFYNNVEALSSFQYAVKGRVIRAFDPVLNQSMVGSALPQEKAIPFNDLSSDYVVDSIQLMSRLTDLTILPADLHDSDYTLAVGVV